MSTNKNAIPMHMQRINTNPPTRICVSADPSTLVQATRLLRIYLHSYILVYIYVYIFVDVCAIPECQKLIIGLYDFWKLIVQHRKKCDPHVQTTSNTEYSIPEEPRNSNFSVICTKWKGHAVFVCSFSSIQNSILMYC